ncbi:hypothetical protein GALL_88420 [mine drainage metagenome]|uniref:Uncharacterized protein n=1 Tax=mine drainage metagenome TaxID=410659 RepID=A0A1J5SK49_9ZZZZ
MKKEDTLKKGNNGEKHGESNHPAQRAIGLGRMGIPNQMKNVAAVVTFTAAGMAAAAAWERGGALIDKVLLVSMSAIIVLAVHLLPALSRRWIVWPVWMGCLLCAMYGHLTFLIHASVHAEENRAQYSALTVGTERQIEVTRESLARISARPVATVAAELAATHDSRQRAALRAEIAEGRRAEVLDDELVKLSGTSTVARGTRETDPVTVSLAEVTGYSDGAVAVVIGMTFSVLIELVGALLWYEVLRHTDRGEGQSWNANTADVTEGVTSPVEAVTGLIKTEAPVIADTSAVTTELSGQVAPVINAIKVGKCRPTVAGIRKYLGCSQARASALRRELAGMGAV